MPMQPYFYQSLRAIVVTTGLLVVCVNFYAPKAFAIGEDLRVSVSYGRNSFDFQSNNTLSNSEFSFDSSARNLGVNVSISIWKKISLEAGFYDLGKTCINSRSRFKKSGDVRFQGTTIMGVFSYPIKQNLEISGKVGVFRLSYETDLDFFSVSRDISLSVAGSLAYILESGWGGSLNYYYHGKGLQSISLGLVKRFSTFGGEARKVNLARGQFAGTASAAVNDIGGFVPVQIEQLIADVNSVASGRSIQGTTQVVGGKDTPTSFGLSSGGGLEDLSNRDIKISSASVPSVQFSDGGELFIFEPTFSFDRPELTNDDIDSDLRTLIRGADVDEGVSLYLSSIVGLDNLAVDTVEDAAGFDVESSFISPDLVGQSDTGLNLDEALENVSQETLRITDFFNSEDQEADPFVLDQLQTEASSDQTLNQQSRLLNSQSLVPVKRYKPNLQEELELLQSQVDANINDELGFNFEFEQASQYTVSPALNPDLALDEEVPQVQEKELDKDKLDLLDELEAVPNNISENFLKFLISQYRLLRINKY